MTPNGAMAGSRAPRGATALRDFRYPKLWLALWIVGMLLTVLACLIRLPESPLRVPVPHLDKIEHLIAYFVLSAWAAMLFATRRALLHAGIGLFGLGLAIEAAQSMLPWRSANLADALANLLGVLGGSALVLTPAARVLQRLDAWVPGRAPRAAG